MHPGGKDPGDRLASERYLFAVQDCPRRALTEIADGDKCADGTADRLSVRRDLQETVERTALVHLKVRDEDVAQRRGIDQSANGAVHQVEEAVEAGFDHRRLLI